MRRLLAALALVGLVALPIQAAGDAAPYAHPLNAGVDHPFGAPLELETRSIEFTAPEAFSRFSIEAHDWLGYDVWMEVCLRHLNVCVRTAEGDDHIVIDAPEGVLYPKGTVARVYVYTAHAWADGETSVATWGGVRAVFGPGVSTTDVVPYVALGYGGPVLGIPVNVRAQCGDHIGAQCLAVPVAARSVRIVVTDEIARDTYFEACLYAPGGSQIACVPASNVANMGGVPLGGTVDVRPYNALGSNLKGTKGYVMVQYGV